MDNNNRAKTISGQSGQRRIILIFPLSHVPLKLRVVRVRLLRYVRRCRAMLVLM